jgi:hypothetical protein
MILYWLAAVKTRGAGVLDDLFKITVVVVAEDFGEVAAGPILRAGVIDSPYLLEGGLVIGGGSDGV